MCPQIPGNGEVRWAKPQWLSDRLGQADFSLVDTQPNIHDYLNEHIPGAVYKLSSARLYEGAFTEWCSHPENPTVTGPKPR
jgi:3-mercaptopyruvate sulfurtransferase SseA